MAHELEIFTDGTASFFSARQDAWHGLGTITTAALTAEEAMTTARLDWTVEKRPLFTEIPAGEPVITEDGVTVPEPEMIAVPGRYATVRTHPETGRPQALGVVGAGYKVVQNLETAQFINDLVDESGAHFETAGSLRGGRQTFVSIRLPKTILVGGEDAVDSYLVVGNSHDGSMALTAMCTNVRVVCKNTMNMALGAATGKITIRHTSGAAVKIEEARRALDLTFAYNAEFEAAAEAMLAAPMSTYEFKQVIGKVFPVGLDAKGAVTTEYRRREADLLALFTTADTNDFGRGTRWAAFNAVTEYTDWVMRAKDAAHRMERVATGSALTTIKHQAYALLTK